MSCVFYKTNGDNNFSYNMKKNVKQIVCKFLMQVFYPKRFTTSNWKIRFYIKTWRGFLRPCSKRLHVPRKINVFPFGNSQRQVRGQNVLTMTLTLFRTSTSFNFCNINKSLNEFKTFWNWYVYKLINVHTCNFWVKTLKSW